MTHKFVVKLDLIHYSSQKHVAEKHLSQNQNAYKWYVLRNAQILPLLHPKHVTAFRGRQWQNTCRVKTMELCAFLTYM